MSVAIITGSLGLIGSEAALYFGGLGFEIAGIDNDMRRYFFGDEASTLGNCGRLSGALGPRYRHYGIDIRDREQIDAVFAKYGGDIELVIHAAAQPSHDWAAQEPVTDFTINAVGTSNVLEATRRYAPDAKFIFTSTNKVYGDAPNRLPLVELEDRYEVAPGHAYVDGIDEGMSVDQCLHSLFGASKLSADVLVQEYGRYFGMQTVCFRGGTLTGPHHAAAPLHGFLAYVMRCVMEGRPYTVIGYKGKQVRDVIHSHDLIRAFHEFFRRPRAGAVYNIGGGRYSHCSVREAIRLCEEIAGRPLDWTYRDEPRIGDHIWWISGLGAFERDYPGWRPEYDLRRIASEIRDCHAEVGVPVTA
jgi:CDP-paratose 2-epimerase